MTICSVAVVGNVLVLLTFKLYKSVRENCTLSLVGQAIADLLLSVGLITEQLAGPVRNLLGAHNLSRAYCISIRYVGSVGVFMSQCTMLFIATERCLAVAAPIAFKNMPKKMYVIGTSCFSFCSGVVIVSTAYIGVDLSALTEGVCTIATASAGFYMSFVQILVLVLASAFLVFYLTGLVVLKRRKKTMDVESQAYQNQIKAEIRVQKTVSVIVLVYIFGWVTPLAGLFMSSKLGHNPGVFWLLIPLGSAINAACNCFIYYWRNEHLRSGLKKIWHIVKNRRVQVQPFLVDTVNIVTVESGR